MNKKVMSIHELLESVAIQDIADLTLISNKKFEKSFGKQFQSELKVELIFESYNEMFEAYNEIKYSSKYYHQYQVETNPYGSSLYVSGAQTLFDYFGTHEPNLLTLSRENALDFKVEYVQEYTGILFNGEIVSGELLGRNCLVELSPVLPELALAGLGKIARSVQEFNTLLTRIYLYESEVIIG